MCRGYNAWYVTHAIFWALVVGVPIAVVKAISTGIDSFQQAALVITLVIFTTGLLFGEVWKCSLKCVFPKIPELLGSPPSRVPGSPSQTPPQAHLPFPSP